MKALSSQKGRKYLLVLDKDKRHFVSIHLRIPQSKENL